ncbi:unnamed protein product [Boreogadus saida]
MMVTPAPKLAWLPPTADRHPRKDLSQVMGNLKVRVKGVRKLRAETATMDPGQTAQDPNQLPNVPDRPPTKELAQVMGNLRFRVKGLRKLRVKQLPQPCRIRRRMKDFSTFAARFHCGLHVR